ncbi:MAG: gluconate:H+ symporter [Bacteroidota bacterium]
MSILITLAGVLCLFLLIAWARLHAFLAFLIVSLALGLSLGLSPTAALESIQSGMGNTLGFLVLILGLGAMIGKLLAESGAATQITQSMVRLFGPKRIPLAMVSAGFLVGIPMFYTVGFVILIPLVFAVAAHTRLPLRYVGIPMLSALSVTHGFLPPHPAPTSIAQDYGADLSLTLLYGLIVAVPIILIGGPWFARRFRHDTHHPEELPSLMPPKTDALPAATTSFGMALLPVLLIAIPPLLLKGTSPGSSWGYWLELLSQPAIAMLLALLVGLYVLGLRRDRSMKDLMKSMVASVQEISMVVLIIGGAGAFKQVLDTAGVSQDIAQVLLDWPVSPLLLAWGIAATIRISIGSATIAALTTAGILAPMALQSGASPELMVLATGAGSLMLSHVNDGGFWLFKEYFQLSIRETFLSWTVMETMISLLGLLGVLLFSLFL